MDNYGSGVFHAEIIRINYAQLYSDIELFVIMEIKIFFDWQVGP